MDGAWGDTGHHHAGSVVKFSVRDAAGFGSFVELLDPKETGKSIRMRIAALVLSSPLTSPFPSTFALASREIGRDYYYYYYSK